MRKLKKREMHWIVKELKKGSSIYFIAKKREVTCQWVRKIRSIYKNTGDIPSFKPLGRRPKPISEDEKRLILKTWEEYPLNAGTLEDYFRIEMNKQIPHNRIHKVLKEAGKAKNEPAKQKRRKWIRYERKHSNSMWHGDWSELDDGKQLVVYEDDASRFITGYGKFDHATSGNALKVFRKAVKRHGCPRQLLTDNGTQFRFNEMFDRPLGVESRFQKTLKKMDVEQIFTRPHHPQCNGKLEKAMHTVKKHAKHFGDIHKAVEFYNYKRPHMSLNFEELETPYQAFKRKMRKK